MVLVEQLHWVLRKTGEHIHYLLGQTIKNIKMQPADNLNINIADLPAGAYLVCINNVFKAKFIKE